MPWTTTTRLPFYHPWDGQTPTPCTPKVVSFQPTPRSAMLVAPPPTIWREKELLEDAERLRGGELNFAGCVCCRDPQEVTPLEPPGDTQAGRQLGGEPPAQTQTTPVPAQTEQLSRTGPPSQSTLNHTVHTGTRESVELLERKQTQPESVKRERFLSMQFFPRPSTSSSPSPSPIKTRGRRTTHPPVWSESGKQPINFKEEGQMTS